MLRSYDRAFVTVEQCQETILRGVQRCHNTCRVSQGHSDFEIFQSQRGLNYAMTVLLLNADRKSCAGIIRLNLNDIKGPFKSNLICLCYILWRNTCSYQPYTQPILGHLEYVGRIIVLVQISTISHSKCVKHVSAENVRGINAIFYHNIPILISEPVFPWKILCHNSTKFGNPKLQLSERS